MSVLDQEKIDAIRRGCWWVECPGVTLVSTSGQRVVSGYGRITNETPGRLTLTLFADARRNPVLQDGQGGDLPHRLNMVATDVAGTEWTSRHASFRALRVPGACATREIRLELDEVWTSPAPVASRVQWPPAVLSRLHLHFVFPRKLEFPTNEKTVESREVAGQRVLAKMAVNVAKFPACGYEFCIEDCGHSTRLSVSGTLDGVTPHMHTRVIEALQFVLAQRCDWSTLEITRGATEETRVRPLSPWLPRPDPMVLPPPVDLVPSNGEHVWRLFECYLAYISDWREQEWHPVSQHLRSVLNASFSLPTESLLPLCVAVEGVLRETFPSGLRAEQGLRYAVERAREYLQRGQQDKSLAVSKRHCDIICRTLHRLTVANEGKRETGDRLGVLASRGVIDEEQVAAWAWFRHRLAHGDRLVPRRGREECPRSDCMVTLLYRLVFNAVRYSGEYSDWATQAVPLVPFTPVPLNDLDGSSGGTD